MEGLSKYVLYLRFCFRLHQRDEGVVFTVRGVKGHSGVQEMDGCVGVHQGYLPSCSIASEVGERACEPAVDFIKR